MRNTDNIINRLNALYNQIYNMECIIAALKIDIDTLKAEFASQNHYTDNNFQKHQIYPEASRVDSQNFHYNTKDMKEKLLSEDIIICCKHIDPYIGTTTFKDNHNGSFTCSICGKTVYPNEGTNEFGNICK